MKPYERFCAKKLLCERIFFSEMNVLSGICVRKIEKELRNSGFIINELQSQKFIEFRPPTFSILWGVIILNSLKKNDF